MVIAVLVVHRRMKRAPKPEHPPKLDYGGAALSAVASALIVFGILKSSSWGWIRPIAAPTINGHEITPLGFSIVPFLIVGGFVVLGCFLAVGGASRAVRPEHPAQSRPAEDRDVARRALVALRTTADRDGDVLRPAGVPPGRARFRRVRDREAALPDVGIDAGRSARRAEGGSSVRAANRRPGRPRRNGDRGARAGRDDRGDAQRDGICGVARVLRHRRRAADVAARQRDHVLVSAGGDERGRAGSRERHRTSARHSAPP